MFVPNRQAAALQMCTNMGWHAITCCRASVPLCIHICLVAAPTARWEATRPARGVLTSAPSPNDSSGQGNLGTLSQLLLVIHLSSVPRVWTHQLEPMAMEDKCLNTPGVRSSSVLSKNKGFGNIFDIILSQPALGILPPLQTSAILSSIYLTSSLLPLPCLSFRRNKIWTWNQEVLKAVLSSQLFQSTSPAIKLLDGKLLRMVNAHIASSNSNTTHLSLPTFLFTIMYCISCRKPFTMMAANLLRQHYTREYTLTRCPVMAHCHLLQIAVSAIPALPNPSEVLSFASSPGQHRGPPQPPRGVQLYSCAFCLTLAVDPGDTFCGKHR